MSDKIKHALCGETPFFRRFASWETCLSLLLASGCWFVYDSWPLEVPQSSNDWMAIISLFGLAALGVAFAVSGIRFGNWATRTVAYLVLAMFGVLIADLANNLLFKF